MKIFLLSLTFLFLLSCSKTNYYIVRHAEKATITMTSDVPLSDMGQQRAVALKNELNDKKIRHIFSTNTIRTKSTAQPLSEILGISIQTYDAKDTTFISRLKDINKNVLIVGHSNTVDNLINGLTGKNLLQDLPESQYGDLFIIKKKGRKYSFEKSRFGQ